MHGFILQDWTTIRGGGSVTTVTQQETDWLDLSPYQDIVFWIDVKEVTTTATLYLQTSPTLDDSFFQSMTTAGIAMAAAAAPTVLPLLMASASTAVPLARYVRWQIVGTMTWDATFRIALAANSPGM
ncbi:MAG TPA: hypothetical protein VGL81_20135 [Polyangiaceae bacterium]|jgi:hypothetical protein